MGEAFSIIVEGQDAFLASIERAKRESFKATQSAIRKAGVPVLAELRSIAAVGSGRDPHPGKLRSSYRVAVQGLSGFLKSSAAYAMGAEWGMGGKWKGFRRYGDRGRFAWKAVERMAPVIASTIERELLPVVTAFGWFR